MNIRLLTHRPEAGWSSPLPSELDSARTIVAAFAPAAYADRDDFWASLAAAFPHSHVLACSSAGAIAGDHVVDDTAAAVVVRFERVEVTSAAVPIQAVEMSRRAGQKLGRALAATAPRVVIVVADGLQVQGSELVQGIAETLPVDTRIVGGLAGDGACFQRTWTLAEGVPRSGWVSALALSGPIEVRAAAQGGWQSFGPERLVTRAEGNIVFELDGRPALAVYAHQLGRLAGELPAGALRFPLAVSIDGAADKGLLRMVRAIDSDTQSLTCAGDVAQGSRVRLAHANHERLVGAAEHAVGESGPHDGGPVLALAISCASRRAVLGDLAEDEAAATLAALPPGSTQIGFYAYGAIAPSARAACDLHNQMLSVVTLREPEGPHRDDCTSGAIARPEGRVRACGRGGRRDDPASGSAGQGGRERAPKRAAWKVVRMNSLPDLLTRQLARLGLTEATLPDAATWRRLLARVDRAYVDLAEESYLLDRAQDVAAQEAAALEAQLQRERDLMDTHVRERTAELAASEARFRSFTSLGSDWYWEQDADFRFTSIAGNTALYPGHSIATHLGKTRWELPEYDPPAEGWEAHRKQLEAHQPFHDVVFRFRVPNGGRAYASVSGEPVFAHDGTFAGYRGIGRDITEQKLAEDNIRRLARFDTLTGLANRASLYEHVDHAIARSRRNNHPFAVLFIDLDRFKDVNDAFGHATGDDVLRSMAQRLQAAIRARDSAARIGGDEFVVVAEEFERPEVVAEFATRLLDALAEPVLLRGQECRVGASIGIALYPADGEDAQTLLKRADVAMYRAKEAGRNAFAFFAGHDAPSSEERMVLAASLRRAIDTDQLLLYYQPKVSLRTGVMTGVEALLRWPHPERGLLLPGAFIPLAEDAGLIRRLGRWALRAACRQAREWSQQCPEPFPVSVNLSARQFTDERLVAEVSDALIASGLPPRLLELEITESAMMEHPDRAAEKLAELRSLGVRFSVDDFGTGFSSLARLKKFPLASVKIDRSFIGDLPEDADDAAITTAVIAMAHSLRLAVIAEGVESAAQVRFLRERNCDEVQGFFFAKPLPAAEVLAFRQRRASPAVAAIGCAD